MIQIYVELFNIDIFLLICFFIAIISFIMQKKTEQKSISDFSKNFQTLSKNLKLTYKKNDSCFDADSENSYLSLILKNYKKINMKKITNKYKFSLLKIYMIETSVFLPVFCIANLYFKFIKIDIMLSLLKSPFIVLCIFPFYLYIKFVQPRETWTRHSNTASLLDSEFYNYIYHLDSYSTIAFGSHQIKTFENNISNIFSKNRETFAKNMQKHIENENSFKNFKL